MRLGALHSETVWAIRDRMQSVVQPLRLKRKISAAGKRPIVSLPKDVVRATDVKVGVRVEIYVEGRRIIIEKES